MKARATFNKSAIDWTDYSWNPVTGCKGPYGVNCEYCYAQELAENGILKPFYPNGFREVSFHEERLQAPYNTRPKGNANKVFLGSMTDMFGAGVDRAWYDQVLEVVKDTPQWTYIMLTKRPDRLKDFAPFPANVWLGATVDTQERVQPTEQAFSEFDAAVKFLSCEPLLEELSFTKLDLFDWLIIGARSKTWQVAEVQPERGWVRSLFEQADKAGVSVFCKANLTSYVKEYPQSVY